MMTPHIVDHFAFPSEFNVLRDMYKFVEWVLHDPVPGVGFVRPQNLAGTRGVMED